MKKSHFPVETMYQMVHHYYVIRGGLENCNMKRIWLAGPVLQDFVQNYLSENIHVLQYGPLTIYVDLMCVYVSCNKTVSSKNFSTYKVSLNSIIKIFLFLNFNCYEWEREREIWSLDPDFSHKKI